MFNRRSSMVLLLDDEIGMSADNTMMNMIVSIDVVLRAFYTIVNTLL
jgi:hypothetical protein